MTHKSDEPEAPATEQRTVSTARMHALTDYIWTCQSALGLAEWDLRLKWDRRPDVDGADAQVRITKNRYLAALYFAEDFFEEPPEEQRITVCHELVHLMFDPTDIVLFDGDLAMVFGRMLWETVTGPLNAAIERVVDRVSTQMAALLPLPDFDKPPA